MATVTAAELGAMDKDAFVAALGGLYEHSPWVAERAHAAGPFESLTAIHKAMSAAVLAASDEEKLALLCAHPDLAGKAAVAGDLTAASTDEQARAGLSQLTSEEMAQFNDLNAQYQARFGFPFILAVRNATKATILGAFSGRVAHGVSQERDECLRQVDKIAWMRLCAGFTPAPTGFLTCHVLDTARGCPAAGLRITLHRLEHSGGGARTLVGDFVTNDDGRLASGPALKGAAFAVGCYEWTFYAGDYFAASALPTGGQPFLDVIPLRFGIDNPEDHYHVPLLASPWSFSTYRGS